MPQSTAKIVPHSKATPIHKKQKPGANTRALLGGNHRWELPSVLVAIIDEHKYAHRLLILLDEQCELMKTGEKPDLECLRDVFHYMTNFPDRYHHPKEELIFDRMQDADAETSKSIESLRHGHIQIDALGKELYKQVMSFGSMPGKRQRNKFLRDALSYSTGLRDHMALEESSVFIPAMTLLNPQDWEAIDTEIKPVIDPVFGTEKKPEYMHLFGRYLNRVVKVSTGKVPVVLIEKMASAAERLIYTSGELSQLPKRLLAKTRVNAREQLKSLGQLATSRDIPSAKLALASVSENCLNGGKSSLSMIRDAFMGIEPLEEGDEEDFSDAVSLTDEHDFLTFYEKPLEPEKTAPISWQAAATNLLFRTTVKQLLANVGTDYAQQTKKMTFLFNKVPPGYDVETVEFDDFHARWIRPSDAEPATKTILYLPGGGFFFPATSGHTSMLAYMTSNCAAQGLMVHYRLAPDHPFPAGLEDALAAYRYLLDLGIKAEDIVVGGDSAGGGLALSLLLAIRNEGLPMPSAAALLSPLTDLSFSTPSRQFNRWRDPMLPTKRKMRGFEMYTGNTPPDDPLLSPIYGNFSGLPPLFAQVSNTEILLDDTLRVARKARAQGVDVEVEVWESLPHDWHLFSYIPESQRALSHVSRFFNTIFNKENASLFKHADKAGNVPTPLRTRSKAATA